MRLMQNPKLDFWNRWVDRGTLIEKRMRTITMLMGAEPGGDGYRGQWLGSLYNVNQTMSTIQLEFNTHVRKSSKMSNNL